MNKKNREEKDLPSTSSGITSSQMGRKVANIDADEYWKQIMAEKRKLRTENEVPSKINKCERMIMNENETKNSSEKNKMGMFKYPNSILHNINHSRGNSETLLVGSTRKPSEAKNVLQPPKQACMPQPSKKANVAKESTNVMPNCAHLHQILSIMQSCTYLQDLDEIVLKQVSPETLEKHFRNENNRTE